MSRDPSPNRTDDASCTVPATWSPARWPSSNGTGAAALWGDAVRSDIVVTGDRTIARALPAWNTRWVEPLTDSVA